MKFMSKIIEVENKIVVLRKQQVLIDSDVAELYGVETKVINQAVNNNLEKFPKGYVLKLSNYEKDRLVDKFDRFKNQKHSSVNPKAFTEKGLYMLATILKTPRAVQTTIAIVEAYAKLKELSRVLCEISNKCNNQQEQELLLKRGGHLVEQIITDVQPHRSSETSFEVNLAMFKFKHSVKNEEQEVMLLRKELSELRQLINNYSDDAEFVT